MTLKSYIYYGVYYGFGASLFVCGACGDGGDDRFSVFQRPVDIRSSGIDLPYDGRTTRFLYVANEFGGTVALVDQDKEELADTDESDDLEGSPIITGGRPVAIAVSDRGAVPRVFAVDDEHNELWAFDAVPPADVNLKEIAHVPVDLGGATVGRASRPIFQEEGRRSTPSFIQVSVDPALAKNEQWELKFEEDVGYKVKGSRSGEQLTKAVEGTAYTTDDGSVTLLVRAGPERTTNDDRFFFGTIVARPLTLTARPVDLQVDSERLYIIQRDPPTVEIFNLSTLAIETTLPLTDGGPTTALPGRAALGGGHLYVSNEASETIFDVDLTGLTVSPISTGVITTALGVDSTLRTLFLISAGERETSFFNLDQAAVVRTIRIQEIGFGFTPFDFNGGQFGLIPTASGALEVIDRVNQTRVDTDVTGDNPQSEAINEEFFDVGAESGPDLVAVNTVDDITRSERWQLVYEGVVNGTANLPVTIAADVLTAVGATFVTAGVVAGDHAILSPNSSPEEVEISEVLSEESVRLAVSPSTQGSTTVEIRPSGKYVVIGSLSGPQVGRVQESVSYTSDDGAIALTIRPSRTKPTTRGDYFSFATLEAVTPIFPSSKRDARAVSVVTRPNETEPTGYVVFPEENVVSVVDLQSLDERKTIR